MALLQCTSVDNMWLYTVHIVLCLTAICHADCNRPDEIKHFEVVYKWQYVNFTPPADGEKLTFKGKGPYNPEKVVIGQTRYYKGKFYLALPRLLQETPVTLATIPGKPKEDGINVPVTAYPSWSMNTDNSCHGLQNVHCFEIDKNGFMWIVDGRRDNKTITDCPPKLIFLNMDKHYIMHVFEFPDHVVSHDGVFLDDILVDGHYAYITDMNPNDPGLVVYNRQTDECWKIRDKTMLGEERYATLIINGETYKQLVGINGIAMRRSKQCKFGYEILYTPLSSHNIYAICKEYVINYNASRDVSKHVRNLGNKGDTSDGITADNHGNVYYGLLAYNSVATFKDDVKYCKILDHNDQTLIWVDGFSFDLKGNLYATANNYPRGAFVGYDIEKYNIRIMKKYISRSTRSYLFAK